MHKYALINPSSLQLKGIVLSSSFNLKNTHDMLAIKFHIACYQNDRQANLLQIFPQKGNILRGQTKKIRVKHKKEQQPDLTKKLTLKVTISLNNEYNKQFLIANHLTGWSQIKSIPLQQHIIPVQVSPDYTNIKSQIRQSVMLSNAFQQDNLSSLQDKDERGSIFQIQQLGIVSRKNQESQLKSSRLSQKDKNYQGFKQNGQKQYEMRRLSHSNLKKNHDKNKIFFGEQPKYTQSNLIEQGRQNSKTKINYVTSPKFSSTNIFKQFQYQKPNNNYNLNYQKNTYSNKNIFNRQQNIAKQSYGNQRNNKSFQSNFSSKNSQKSFKTANKQSFIKENSFMNENIAFSKRNVEFIIMAIISAFFVALGSNIGKLFIN